MFERPKMPDVETDVVIIGAGPTGITAAKTLKNAGLEVWILGSAYESQIAKAGPLKNVEKIAEGTNGLDHIEAMINEAKSFGINHKTSLSIGIDLGPPHTVKTKYQNFRANKVLIATGAKQKKLGFTGESDYLHKGISDCAACDWGLFRGKDVAVVGNHDYTLRAAKFLVPHASSVALLWLEGGEGYEIEGINLYANVENLEAGGDEVLSRVKFVSQNQDHELTISGLFVEGKPIPSTEFLNPQEFNLNDGYLVVNDRFETGIKGIWGAGDVTGQTFSYDGAVSHGEQVSKIMIE